MGYEESLTIQCAIIDKSIYWYGDVNILDYQGRIKISKEYTHEYVKDYFVPRYVERHITKRYLSR